MGLAAILILRKIIFYSPYFFTESDILIAIYSSIIWQDRSGSEYFLDRSAVDGGGGNAWEARRRRLSAEDRVYEMERRRFERSNRRMCEVGDTNRGGFGRRCLIRPNRISSGETSLGSFARRSGQCRLHEKPRVQGFHSSRFANDLDADVQRLLKILASVIGDPALFEPGSTRRNFRMVDYVARLREIEAPRPRCGEHRDFGPMTLIFQDGRRGSDAGGLQ